MTLTPYIYIYIYPLKCIVTRRYKIRIQLYSQCISVLLRSLLRTPDVSFMADGIDHDSAALHLEWVQNSYIVSLFFGSWGNLIF